MTGGGVSSGVGASGGDSAGVSGVSVSGTGAGMSRMTVVVVSSLGFRVLRRQPPANNRERVSSNSVVFIRMVVNRFVERLLSFSQTKIKTNSGDLK